MRRGSGSGPAWWLQVLSPFLLLLFHGALADQIRYSIPEELAKNSIVGNLARDLGLSVQNLPTRKLRVSAEKDYFTVNPESGDLLVGDRIDREQVCGKQPQCVLEFDIVAEKPLNIFHVAVILQDVNDNAPLFKQSEVDLNIGESTRPGKAFPLDPALDLDAGSNSLQKYYLTDNEYFEVTEKETPDGRKYPELILNVFWTEKSIIFTNWSSRLWMGEILPEVAPPRSESKSQTSMITRQCSARMCSVSPFGRMYHQASPCFR